MSTEHTSDFHREILRRLNGVRRKENRLALLYGALATVLISIALLLLVVVPEEIFSLGVTGRTILLAAALTVLFGVLGWFVIRPILRAFGIIPSDNNETVALKIGAHFPAIRDRLLDALQMYEGRDRLQRNYSIDLIDASFTDLYQQIQPLKFTQSVNDSNVRKMGKIVSYAFGVFLLIVVTSPSAFFGSFYRVVHYNESFAASLPIQITVEPGNTEVVRGQNVSITVRTSGKPVQTLSLLTRQQGQIDFDAQALKPLQNGIFRTDVNNIKTSTEYYATVEDIKSDKYTITVLDRPLIRSMQLKVTPPSYTRLPARALDENAGDLSGYPGSTVSLQLSSSKELSSAAALFSDKSTLNLSTSGVDASGSFRLKETRTYHIVLKDRDGLPNIDPVEYTIKIIPDEFPTAEILVPAKNLDLTEEMKLDLFMRIKDDFGFSKLRLAYRLAQSRFEKPAEEFTFVDIPLQQRNENSEELWFHWDLSTLHLVPEDALAYYVEVFDNDNVNGPKSGKSEMYMVRLPSLEEVFSDVSQTHQESMESMQSVAKETQQMKRDVEDLQQEMKKNPEKMDWQQQKKAEAMQQRYEAMKKKLDEMTKKMDEAVKKMEDNKLLSNETLEKYLELQKLMEQLKSPDLQEALKKLQESMKQLSPEQMKEAMEKMKNSEEQFRKNLERMISLLKRIHIEQKVDELIKRAQEMEKHQDAVKQQTAQTKSSDEKKRDELTKQQQDLQKQAESLEKETTDLQKKMEEFPKEMPLDQMKKAQDQLQKNQIGQKMQKSSQHMQSGQMQEAQDKQEQSEKDLSDFEEQMKDVQSAMEDKQNKQIVNEMRKQLENVLELSMRQESLKEDTKSLDPNSRTFRDGAERQNEMKSDLGNVADKMAELSKKTFAVGPEMSKEIGNALKQMDEAQEGMEGRNPGGSSDKQGEAMSSLNRAAMMMQSALSGMQGGKGGSGMGGLMGALGQMMGTQSGINQGTKQAMGEGGQGGEGMTPSQQAEYQRLAGAQGAVQKSLKELANEAKNSGEFSKLLGDLDKVADEMQEVQTDLEQGNVNPNTIKKQDHILSRLLDSQHSMRERDYEKKRTAEAGKTIPHTSPADIDLSTQEGKNKLREEMLRVLEGKYSKDYEALIKKYFERLEKEDVKQ